jgi:hypothetical protein
MYTDAGCGHVPFEADVLLLQQSGEALQQLAHVVEVRILDDEGVGAGGALQVERLVVGAFALGRLCHHRVK